MAQAAASALSASAPSAAASTRRARSTRASQPARCVRAERARELCARGAPHFMRAAWWVGVHIVSVCFHLSWSLRGQVGHTVSCRLPLWPLRRGGGALRAGQDAAGGRAEGVPRSKCVLLEILHPHVQEQAAESLRLARYGPANGWGPGVRAQTRSGTKNSHSAPAKSHAFVCPISCIAAPKIGRGLPLRGPKCFFVITRFQACP